MAVYTSLSPRQLSTVLSHFGIRDWTGFAGIEAGIENTNYRVHTPSGDFILTLYENQDAADITPFLVLLHQLNQFDYPAPLPVAKDPKLLHTVQNKPAALFCCLPGRSVTTPNTAQLTTLGQHLARLHQFSDKLDFSRPNPRNLAACKALFQQLEAHFSPGERHLIHQELAYQTAHQPTSLPAGLLHADLFRDNVLFTDNTLTAILDFYTACRDVFILDLAITCNDWCIQQGKWQPDLLSAFFRGYQSVRPLTEKEKKYWPVYCRFAALRFWLSRSYHHYFPRNGELTLQKDPDVFHQLLEYHIIQTPTLDLLLTPLTIE